MPRRSSTLPRSPRRLPLIVSALLAVIALLIPAGASAQTAAQTQPTDSQTTSPPAEPSQPPPSGAPNLPATPSAPLLPNPGGPNIPAPAPVLPAQPQQPVPAPPSQAPPAAAGAPPVTIPAPAPVPTTPAQPIFLIYRGAPAPFGHRDTVSALVFGDHSGAIVHLRLIASDGRAGSPAAAIRGSDSDTEPLWPQWISPAVTLNYRGWKKIVFPISQFSYRPPMGASAGAGSSLSPSSADAFGVDFDDRGETAMLDNLTWSSAASGGDPPLVVEDFETGNFAAWQEHGTPETIADGRIALVTDRAKVQAGRVALGVSFSPAKLARSQMMSVMKATLAATGQGYLTYVPASPFRRIIPTSVPLTGETAKPIQIFACADQTEPGSFCIYSDTGLQDVTIAPSTDLRAIGSVIDRSNIDIRVVKVWNRTGTGQYRDTDASGPLPELLMKDDRQPLQMVAGQLPEARLTGDPTTTIPAHATKQFWVAVHVPRDTKPGHYSAQLAIRAPGARPSSVSLLVEVLPIQLYSPSKQYVFGLAANGNGAGRSNSADVAIEGADKDTVAAALMDIHDHGFLYATLADAPDALPDTIQAYRQADLGMRLMYSGLSGSPDADMPESDEIESGRRAEGIDSVAYFVPGRDAVDELAALHKANRTTAAFVTSSDQFDAEQASLDMPIYSIDEPYVQQLLRTGGKRTSDKYDYWFWPAYESDPQMDRLYAGYLLARANLYGAYVPAFGSSLSGDPFVDDPSAPGASSQRPAMLMYPVKGGVLDTVQWEAVAAGVDDMRYLTTYYAALRECKDNHVAKSLAGTTEQEVKAMMSKAFWVMDDTQYQQARRVIAHDTVLLRQELDKFYSHGGGDPLKVNASLSTTPAKPKAPAAKPK